jgi:hypothetical protein
MPKYFQNLDVPMKLSKQDHHDFILILNVLITLLNLLKVLVLLHLKFQKFLRFYQKNKLPFFFQKNPFERHESCLHVLCRNYLKSFSNNAIIGPWHVARLLDQITPIMITAPIFVRYKSVLTNQLR